MNATRLLYLAALPLALAACGGGDEGAAEGAGDGAMATTDTASMAAPPAATPAPMGDSMGGQMAGGSTVQMMALNNSGVTGQAQIAGHSADETMITVTLTGQGSGTHPGHVHAGTCDNLGAVVVPLQSVTLANGTGTSTSTAKVPLATVMNGQHVVNFHAGSGADPMQPVVCGPIAMQGAAG